MAIQNARILIRRGNEVDFDANNMQPGEWALSTDEKIVRICVAPGVCIRMATYDAFETDMAKIEAILEQAKSIKEAVTLINTEVSENAKAVAEYTEQAKQYRDEAEQFRNEAEAFAPEGYSELVQNVEENTVKIETILEKGGLTFDESASGESIHLTDSTDNKATAFALYGKAEQKQYSGKNLLENTATTQTVNGVTFTVNEDKSITVNGTSTSTSITPYNIGSVELDAGTYICAGCPVGGAIKTYNVRIGKGASNQHIGNEYGEGYTLILTEKTKVTFTIHIGSGYNANNIIFFPMIRLASISDDTYEPYTGGIASPNPDYPIEINVSGAGGSVEVVSCGKNFLKNTVKSQTINDVTFTANEDRSVTANGTATATCQLYYDFTANISVNDLILTGCPSGGGHTSYWLTLSDRTEPKNYIDYGNGAECGLVKGHTYRVVFVIYNGQTVSDFTFYPMISIEGGEYEPYKETVSTIPTPNGLCGIKVSSGGNYTDENGQQWICDSIVKYADGTGKYVQRVGKDIYDGSDDEVIKNSVFEKQYVIATNNLHKEKSNGYSSQGIVVQNTSTTVLNEISFYDTINCYGTFDFETLEDFKAHLTENPMTLYYELAEPIITDLSAEEIAEIEKLQTFYPVTNISNDADCYMEVAYKADAKNYIDNIILSRLATLETAVINNL